MTSAATAAKATAPHLRRKFATLAIINSLLTTVAILLVNATDYGVWPRKAGYGRD